MTIARTAKKYGARIVTRAEVVDVLRTGKRITGVKLSVDGKKPFEVKAKVTVLAGGVWTTALYEKFDIKPGYQVRMSKGSHIVVPGDAITAEGGVIIKTNVSVLFIIPWFGKWIVGTTDTDYHEDPNSPVASDADIDYILDQANRVLKPRLKRSDVIGVYAGLRPLISSSPDSPTTKLSREHIVDRPQPGFVSIAGGKYTTYRVMAEDAVDIACAELRRITPDSETANLPLVGADGYQALRNRLPVIASQYGISEEIATHLIDRYGTLMIEVLDLGKAEKLLGQLDPTLPYLKAEIRYATIAEGAMTLSDIMDRRTRIGIESDDHGLAVIEEVALIAGKSLGWSAARRRKEIEEFKEHVAAERIALPR
jgi:glycerol-3-phosphate dehydrogenase